MSSGQSGREPSESNTALIVTIVLAVLMIPTLFLCGGAAALFWILRTRSMQPAPLVEAVPIYDSHDWAAAAEAGLQSLENAPDDTLSWLRVAPLVVLAGDESEYRDFCSRMAEQFVGTEDVQTAERTCKACLLVPGAIELDELPHITLAGSLDDGTAPDEIASWLWSARSLVAYRNGDAESAVAYAQKADELNQFPMAEALLLAIRASARHQLGQSEQSRSDVFRAHEVIDEIVKSNSNLRRHHDILMARILLQEAEALLKGEADSKPTDSGTPSDETSEESESAPEAAKTGPTENQPVQRLFKVVSAGGGDRRARLPASRCGRG